MGEKLSTNPTGTCSMSVPLPASPARAGFAPQLSLTYDSGAGNGAFGFGWSLGIPAISRKTDRGLPRYRDAEESDVFILAGAEDLVPVEPNGTRSEGGFAIRRYRPRVEGLFARIERWTEQATGSVHWRSVTRDNITTIYGADTTSRVFDPADPRRVFRWLISESYDDKGNALVYEYAGEDGAGVARALASERDRVRTAERYVKRIRYGNRISRLVEPSPTEWLFELVFDYDEGHLDAIPANPGEHRFVTASAEPARAWAMRPDPFSSYRAGFEIRIQRRCKRILMFHRFDELGSEPCLVRALELDYADYDYSVPASVDDELEHDGSTRTASFVRAIVQSGYVRDSSRTQTYLEKSLPPLELDYSKARIHDAVHEVDGIDNVPGGVDGARYQWTDLDGEGLAGILTEQAGGWFYKPNLGGGSFGAIQQVARVPSTTSGEQQLIDMNGDGRLEYVALGGPTPGFFARTDDADWEPYRAFRVMPNLDWRDPNVRFLDLDGDGQPDVLLTEDDLFTWYPSLRADGFDAARRVRPPIDDDRGARLVFADGTQSIYLADMSGDSLTDLVRIRNGEVCYWPNLGYGRFGTKVVMDAAPWFDAPDRFDQRRIRIADIDGSGTSDLIYLGGDGVRLYFNQSGNRFTAARRLHAFPRIDDLSTVTVADVLGNGTACLVWSSPLATAEHRPLRYVDLMGGTKPHLLIAQRNNLGAETAVTYAASTRFYLEDKRAGRPWVTRIPFPVQVVERVEIRDHISRNQFVTRYAYHHGYYDGEERELRGFALVEQLDTELIAALDGDNIDVTSHVPPVLTKTWFHTGSRVARDYSAELYREPGSQHLDDTVLPAGLTTEEEREACRALRGSMLRREVFALDGTARQAHPYTVTEQNHAVRMLQPRGEQRHAVFLTHARESLAVNYERVVPHDPRIAHSLTLAVDDFGNVLAAASITYGRREEDPALPTQADRDAQTRTHVTLTEHAFTNAIDTPAAYRTPMPAEARTYELTGLVLAAGQTRFAIADLASVPTASKRLVEQLRTLYRRDDLTGPLVLQALEPRALPFETYRLAFTPELVTEIFETRVDDVMLADEGRYVHAGDASWWVPSGRLFYSPDPADSPAQELAYALQHFMLPHRLRDPFHTSAVSTESSVTYDRYDLLVQETRDALGNRITAGERDAAGVVTVQGLDYRTLQPWRTMDPNRNRSDVAYDALGMLAGTAVLGKPAPSPPVGDSLAGFAADLTEDAIVAHLADPFADPLGLLQGAGTRLVYDLFAFHRTRDTAEPRPAGVCTIAREAHGGPVVRQSFVYSDGFSRQVQSKMEAEPGPGPTRDGAGRIVVDAAGDPIPSAGDLDPRWVGSGWTVFDNKGNAVRKFEPFFTDTHVFERDVRIGVSPVTFYDPIGRVVGGINPDHTWHKVVFDPWREETWDASDTALIADPSTDEHVGGYVARLPVGEVLPTWHGQRIGGALGLREQAAARQVEVHAATPAVTHVDALGRKFLAIAHNRFKYTNVPATDPPIEERPMRRVVFDIEGNEREISDAAGRTVMRYAYDLLGNRLHGASFEAGARWTLNDVAGKPVRNWDTIGNVTRTEYDPLRRPIRSFVGDVLAERLVYGEQHPDDVARNLRGTLHLRFDQSGVAADEERDFERNLLRVTRRLAREYKQLVDWSSVDAALPANAIGKLVPATLEAAIAPLVASEQPFTTSTVYDALGRPTELIAPDNSIVHLAYNEAKLVDRIDVTLEGAARQPFVTDLDHDAKGQRTRIVYGNGVETTYAYDRRTLRVARVVTTRAGNRFQDLSYTYDAAGNVTHVGDAAQQTLYFRNHRIDPSASYTYDALYRLIEATGREHLGQILAPIPHSSHDAPRVGIAWSANDGAAMGAYLERYHYDLHGNITEMEHRGSDPVHPGWTRTFQYDEPNNRLSSTQVGVGAVERYVYDLHGNMIRMPHLGGGDPTPNMRWDHKNQLVEVDRGGGGMVYFVYDTTGNRVRKIWEKSPGLVEERIYLGGFELFRRRNGAGTVTLERSTLHVMDDAHRVALVETRTKDLAGDDPAPAQLVRYQHTNHLGSATLELDEHGAIISYEEYTPYGSTAYQAVRSETDTPKRYRYTGMERDDETGLCLHGARYYAPWLARWTATDPAGLVDGDNLYRYSRDNPILFTDPGGTEPPSPAPTWTPPTRPSRYSLGEFTIPFAHPVNDPGAHAQYFDLLIPGALGVGFNLLDLGNRTTNPAGRITLNTLEFLATGLLTYGPAVASHELGGHVGAYGRFGVSAGVRTFFWFGGSAGPDPGMGGGLTWQQNAVVDAGGANQQTINATATYSRVTQFGYFTPQDAWAYLLGQAGTAGYALRTLTLSTPPPSDDINNYAGYPNSWSVRDIAITSTITALPALAGLVYSAIQFIGHNRRSVEVPSLHFGSSGRITFPHLQTLLAPSGTIIGASSYVSFGNDRPGLDVGIDVRPTSDFALAVSARAHGLRVTPRLELNPFLRVTAASTPGVYFGAEAGLRVFPWLSANVSGEAGINDIRADVEGLPAGSTFGGGAKFDLRVQW